MNPCPRSCLDQIKSNQIYMNQLYGCYWHLTPSVEIGNPLEPLQLPPQILQHIQQAQITISNSHKYIKGENWCKTLSASNSSSNCPVTCILITVKWRHHMQSTFKDTHGWYILKTHTLPDDTFSNLLLILSLHPSQAPQFPSIF